MDHWTALSPLSKISAGTVILHYEFVLLHLRFVHTHSLSLPLFAARHDCTHAPSTHPLCRYVVTHAQSTAAEGFRLLDRFRVTSVSPLLSPLPPT